MKSLKKHTPVRDGLTTAEATLGRVGRVRVGEHDEGDADRQVSPIARYREKGSNLPSRKAEEPSPSSSCNFVHVFIVSHSRQKCKHRWVVKHEYQTVHTFMATVVK